MARPKKEGMDYFPHDTDAVNDEKIEALRLLYGNDGYAFYFILLERIYRSKNFELDISDAETIQILCRKIDVNLERFNQILETALKRGCFCRDSYELEGLLTSEGIKKRANVVVEKRSRMADKYRQDKDEGVSAAETTAEMQQKVHKVKESKVKESKVVIKEILVGDEPPLEPPAKKMDIPYVEIIDYLNKKTGKKFSPDSTSNRELIRARIRDDNFAIEDFYKVIDNKVREWKHSPYWSKFLRPSTLFRKSNFDNYLNEGGEHGEIGNDLDQYDFSKVGFADDDEG
jgi:uncharacterized phage protein (TIGR02220 family)